MSSQKVTKIIRMAPLSCQQRLEDGLLYGESVGLLKKYNGVLHNAHAHAVY
jgi:hypothetical protein